VSRPRKRLWPWLLLIALVSCAGWGGIEYARLPEVTGLSREDPKTTALIERRTKKGAKREQVWVGLHRISEKLQWAVIVSEDASFWSHEGYDLYEVWQALWRAPFTGRVRGASTLTQQLAKNLYLSEDRSLLRKGKELVLARRLETSLDKKRILELYLNVVEWGDGIYGAEAAARAYFGKPAADLDAAEAAALAARLPSPKKRNLKKPSKKYRAAAWRTLDLMRQTGHVSEAEFQAAKAQLKALLGARP
jgi:monofunctional biosynthetic peptidoglycan transglycosylase